MKKLPTVEKLCDELFHAVQKHQGFAHISDGMGAMTHEQFFAAVCFALDHSKVATETMRAFLVKYGQIKPKRRGSR